MTSAADPAPDDLTGLSDDQVARIARQAVQTLSGRPTTDAFRLLYELSAELGVALGESARRLAEQGSWTQVGAISGTTKQAAWSRWR